LCAPPVDTEVLAATCYSTLKQNASDAIQALVDIGAQARGPMIQSEDASEIYIDMNYGATRRELKKNTNSKMNRWSLALVAWMGTLLMLPVQAVYISISASRVAAQQLASQLPQEQLKQLAQSITVKLWKQWGSGILINKKGQIYRFKQSARPEPPLIRTPDRKPIKPIWSGKSTLLGNDLALLQFRANGDYAVASLGTST